jgi:hypothetical protein
MKNRIYYEVRTKGDGDFIYFVEDEYESGEYGEFNYSKKNKRSATKHAKKVGGWVVKITEEII